MNFTQVSIWGRSHRMDLGEKKISIEWEVLRGSPPNEGSTNLPPEDVADSTLRRSSDYVMDVYLTE